MADKQEIKTGLFGVVKKPLSVGGHAPKAQIIRETVRKTRADIASFCAGCGYTIGLIKDDARKIAERENIQLPDSGENIFLQTEECVICGTTCKGVTIQTLD